MCEICFSVNFTLTQWVFPHIVGIKREIFIAFGVRLDYRFFLCVYINRSNLEK